MIIKNLKINRYKSIRKPLFLNFSNLNIFIGQNNCGKTNILDAIELSFNKKKDKTNLFYPNSDIELNLEFNLEEQKSFSLDKDLKLNLKSKNRFNSGNLPLNFLNKKIKRLNEEAFLNYSQIEKDYKSLINYSQSLNKFRKNLKKHFPKIIINENALDINYQNDGLYEGKRRVTIDYLGSGFGRIFTILLYIFHPEYQVVIINEPEIHLHPAIIKKLLWAMKNSQAGQIFFTTHSPLFITTSTLKNVFRVVKESQNTKVFSLNFWKGNNYEYERLLQELNDDNLEMFFADKVVLVEGSSDRLLLRGLLNRYYKGNKEVKIVQTYGKTNMSIYSSLLKIFKIPFLIVLDRDILRGFQLRDLMRHLNIKLPGVRGKELIKKLRKYNIFIFPNGDLEANYPRKYQTKDSKPMNVLLALSLLTDQDFYSSRMKNLREIIQSI